VEPQRSARDWLAIAQSQLASGKLAPALWTLAQGLLQHPDAPELRRARAGVLHQVGRDGEAESLLRELLSADPGDAASAFALAGILKAQGRTAAAASMLVACFARASNRRDADLAIRAIELLDECDRKAEAASIAAAAMDANPQDPRLHAYAGMLLVQLGEFEKARQHYLFALGRDRRAWEWHAGIGLASAQRYRSAEHPDFTLLRTALQDRDLTESARAELHFALGKAYDDVAEFAQAEPHFREGNAIAHRSTRWSRKAWRRVIEARLASKPITCTSEPSSGFTPVFIVGMPRSGTTLLAELLSRHPGLCNRGELPWIARLAGQPALAGNPDRAALQRAASTYAMLSRQDDAPGALWFIDKQPLNFRYVDLMLALFPDAKIIHCRRSCRDTALSLWMQNFLEDVQGYAYDFDDIMLVMRDCERLMLHWRNRWPDSIRIVEYENLVADTDGIVGSLMQWIGVPSRQTNTSHANVGSSAISTASLWQARQPVNARSVGRWKHYADCVPELLRFPDGPTCSR